MQLGKFLKEKRDKKGLSVNKTAKLIGVEHPTLLALENDKTQKPSFEIIVNLARVLEIDLFEIIAVMSGKNPDKDFMPVDALLNFYFPEKTFKRSEKHKIEKHVVSILKSSFDNFY